MAAAELAQPGVIFLTGGTGYVGGRLLRVLEERGTPVTCLARRPQRLQPRVRPGTTVVAGDLSDPSTYRQALQGASAAYYLAHAMDSRRNFEDQERAAAQGFADAAREAGVGRIIYLGGLGTGHDLSAHLTSRHEVGRILRNSGVPTFEFRASIVIGSGSLSYEMIRSLVEKLPFMVTPRWVQQKTQPIAVEDLLSYLTAALDAPVAASGVYEIGGADQVSYLDLMKEYARQTGLRRLMIPVPVLSPGLSSIWLSLFTPLYARVGRRLVDSLRNDTVVTENAARRVFSGVQPRGIAEAIARARAFEDREFAETQWSDALSAFPEPPSFGGVRLGRRIVDSRAVHVSVPPALAFRPIRRIGGRTGWYYGEMLWRLRGILDLLAGGPGLRRGRRDPDFVAPGDNLDFWRVEAVEPDRLLRLRAEMRVPGRAWLQFEVTSENGGSIIRQTAIFEPAGLLGQAYWYSLYPIHELVFAGMLRGIARAARASDGGGEPGP